MKSLSRTLLLTLTAASLGAVSFAPAMAQPAPEESPAMHQFQQGGPQGQRPGFGPQGPRPGFGFQQHRPGGEAPGLIGVLFSGNAEAIDVAAVRLTHRLELTDEQVALLDALKEQALDAQIEIADIRESLRPVAEEDAADPDLVARFAGLVAMTTARAEALESMQPAFDAFVGSLTDEQVEKLEQGARPGPQGPFGHRPQQQLGAPHHQGQAPAGPQDTQAPRPGQRN